LKIFFFLIILNSYCFAKTSLIGGSESEQNNGVFHIAIQEKGSTDIEVCTASKVGPRSFLTAAHCFDGHKTYSLLLSTESKNPDFDFEIVEIEKLNIHPSYKSEDDSNFAQSDVAIVTISSSVIFSELETLDVSFEEVSSNSKVQIWGFGCQESLHKLETYYPVKKFSETIVEDKSSLIKIDGLIGETIREMADDIYAFNFSTPGKTKSKMESSLCFGDSGGPVLLNNKIIGVNAETFMADLDENGETLSGISYLNQHTRISKLKNWFSEVLKSN
jgi:secreted trypsin-like serine protease